MRCKVDNGLSLLCGQSGLKALLAASAAAIAVFSVPAHAQVAPVYQEDSGKPDTTAAQNIQQAIDDNTQSSTDQIRFTADTLEYNQNDDIVTASGNVVLVRDTQKLQAEKIVWDRKTGVVDAIGNVRISDENDNVIYGENITLTDDIRDGAIENILVVLGEGGRIAAQRGVRKDGFITLDRAVYSPYPIEKADGSPRKPTWQIKAVKVIYDPNEEKLRYKGARLELFGLPLIPLPGLSHSIGDSKESGLLVPNIRFSRTNGVEYEQPYYFALAENRDLTLTGSVYSQVLPMVSARYRAFTDRGAYQITGYGTFSRRIPAGQTGANINSEQDFRGYVDASGKFQLTPEWDVSASIRATTDRTFLRRYDISRDDRLRSNVQAQRVDDNSYFSVNGWFTQTLRVNDPQGQVPLAFPIIDYRRRLTDPVLGGNVKLQLNSLAIGRTDGQDTQRAFASAQWDLRRLTSLGQELTLTAYARGDIYHSSDNELTPTPLYRGNSGFEGRGVASLAADVRWPFIGQAFGGTQVITPHVQIVATPETKNLSIPNEDARAIELEDGNLFALNRFPGYDRVEDGVRIVYGLEYQLTRPGLTVDTVIGQSYRLDSKINIFPDGTGLANRTSDIVGRTNVRFRDFVQFTHRYRLDKDTLAIRRNEIDATVGSRRTYASVGYLRLNRDIEANIEDLQDREEIRGAGRVQFAKYWSLFGSGVVDLTDREEDDLSLSDGFQPIRTRLGIGYQDEYFEAGLTWRRDYITTGDARSGNTFLFRIGFRNLGF